MSHRGRCERTDGSRFKADRDLCGVRSAIEDGECKLVVSLVELVSDHNAKMISVKLGLQSIGLSYKYLGAVMVAERTSTSQWPELALVIRTGTFWMVT